jgi:1,4-alpha-glucan branching enzyme
MFRWLNKDNEINTTRDAPARKGGNMQQTKTKTKTQGQSNGDRQKDQKVRDDIFDVVFTLDRPDAQVVYLAGDFNEWAPRSTRMFHCDKNGRWERHVILPAGRYEYQFVVDDEWVHDNRARENKPNTHGSLNSVIEVPYGSTCD